MGRAVDIRRQEAAYRRKQSGYHRRWKLANRFGLTLEEYDAMLVRQGGACAICGKTPDENGKNLSVDHDHETEEIRGLLCQPCNLALGILGSHLMAALLYLGGERSSQN